MARGPPTKVARPLCSPRQYAAGVLASPCSVQHRCMRAAEARGGTPRCAKHTQAAPVPRLGYGASQQIPIQDFSESFKANLKQLSVAGRTSC